MAGILYIISAPSGSGKSTLVNELRSMVPNLDFSVSYTTRPARGSEQNGREYYFISRPEFERMIAQDTRDLSCDRADILYHHDPVVMQRGRHAWIGVIAQHVPARLPQIARHGAAHDA